VIRRVTVNRDVLQRAHEQYGEQRSAVGRPSEYDFVAGPLAAAQFAFRGFDELSYDIVPSVRWYTVVDPFFGPVTFVGLLLDDDSVEIVGFESDPDYWEHLGSEPD
jgi:hypothetical protein